MGSLAGLRSVRLARYDYDALEPYVDEETMRLHHDKHHQTYVTNANHALEGTEWADRPVEEVLQNLDQISDEKRNAVRNNAGGHYNHSRFSRQPSDPPDYVLIAEITEVDRWQLQASEQVQRLADDLAHLVSARRMLVLERVL